MKISVRRWLAILSVVAVLAVCSHVARTEWCSRQLDIPIFQDGDLTGNPDRIIAKLGKPAHRLRLKTSSPTRKDLLHRLFWRGDRVKLDGREVELLLWERRCLGSVIWQFAVATDPASGRILTVGGDSSFYSLIYLGGGGHDE